MVVTVCELESFETTGSCEIQAGRSFSKENNDVKNPSNPSDTCNIQEEKSAQSVRSRAREYGSQEVEYLEDEEEQKIDAKHQSCILSYQLERRSQNKLLAKYNLIEK